MKVTFVSPHKIRRELAGQDVDRFQRTGLLSRISRLNTLSMIKYAGSGHIGSSFSSLELVSWILGEEVYRVEGERWVARDDRLYFSSKGHDVPGFYSAMVTLGAFDEDRLTDLRRLGGLPGHPDVGTEGVITNSGSLGMGISKAKGMALARRIQDDALDRIYILLGDGELQEGQIWESLGSASNLGLGEICAIVDHNKLQSDTLVSRVSDLGDLERKFASFGWVVRRCDGHDFGEIERAISIPVGDEEGKPLMVIADTIKGKGVSFMEHASRPEEEFFYPYHAGAPSDDDYVAALEELKRQVLDASSGLNLSDPEFKEVDVPASSGGSPAKPVSLIACYERALTETAAENKGLVALDADLLKDTGLSSFREQFPNRFIECGIAEMDMVSMAGGLALNGMLPFVHSFACFLSPRPNEQIFNNATEGSHIVYVGSLAGVLPGGPGHSHQCVRDISALAGVPGMIMAEPATAEDLVDLVGWFANQHRGPGYLRLVSIPVETLSSEFRPVDGLQLGQGYTMKSGSDCAIIGYGPVLLQEALEAARDLDGEVSVKVVNLPWLNRFDASWLREELRGFRSLLLLDNHFEKGGQSEQLASFLLTEGITCPDAKVKRLGLDRIPECGGNAEVLRAHGLDRDSLVRQVRILV